MRTLLTVQFAQMLPLFVLFFLLKIKKRISVESYFQDIILEIGFFLQRSNPHCHLSRDNILECKREARVIVSYSVWLSFHGKKQPFVGVT